MKFFDVVMLREDLPTEGLRRGQTGAIIEVAEREPRNFGLNASGRRHSRLLKTFAAAC